MTPDETQRFIERRACAGRKYDICKRPVRLDALDCAPPAKPACKQIA
jgi:hypothetical protein